MEKALSIKFLHNFESLTDEIAMERGKSLLEHPAWNLVTIFSFFSISNLFNLF